MPDVPPILRDAARETRIAFGGSITLGAAVFATIVTACVAGPFTVSNPDTIDLAHRLTPPSAAHWLGTDSAGRDVLARVLNGGRLDLLIATSGVLISFLIGSALGLLLGFFAGRLSEIFMRTLDVTQGFPLLVLALTLLAVLGSGVLTFIYAIAFAAVPIFIRLVRSETLGVRQRPYVEAAISVGNSTLRVIFRHVLPNVVTSALIQLTSTAGTAILIVGGLSFLGVGIQPPKSEWGSMIQGGSQFLVTGQWWPSMFPAIAVVLTIFSLHTMSEGFVSRRQTR